MPEWLDPHRMEPMAYVCAYCGTRVTSERGYSQRYHGGIFLCPGCQEPTYLDGGNRQVPGVPYGDPVGNLPADVRGLYEEARNAIAVGAFTSSVMGCRKLLMHVAVEKGAAPNLKFFQYVEYLNSKGYIPPDGKGWVDHIRDKGNEANHEIKLMGREDACDLVDFAGMLLKFVYEFPARISKKP